MTADDPRYDQLLAGLQLGEAPAWLDAASRGRFELAADGHRLCLARDLAVRFPRASFYASARLGPAYLVGVGRALVGLPPGGAPFSAKVVDAIRAWGGGGRPEVEAMFDYDEFVGAEGEPYGGPDRDALRASAGLPERFALRQFGYEVLGFAALLDRFREGFAPPEIVGKYGPSKGAQRLTVYRAGAGLVVREVSPP